jgi:hypothetical protein
MHKDDKTLLGAFILPLILAINCLCMLEYLRQVDKDLCKPVDSSEKISFSIHYAPSLAETMFFPEVIPCSSTGAQFFYRCLSLAVIICFGLAALLPCIIFLRHNSVDETKIFE